MAGTIPELSEGEIDGINKLIRSALEPGEELGFVLPGGNPAGDSVNIFIGQVPQEGVPMLELIQGESYMFALAACLLNLDPNYTYTGVYKVDD